MATVTLTSKGQMTIPKDIRDRLGLKQGDRLDLTMQPDGSVRIVARNLDISELQGLLGKPKRRVSIAEMNQAIAEGWTRRWRRFEKQSKAKSRARS
jgi:antitoxin PrlF